MQIFNSKKKQNPNRLSDVYGTLAAKRDNGALASGFLPAQLKLEKENQKYRIT
jgi:hypothetical protein